MISVVSPVYMGETLVKPLVTSVVKSLQSMDIKYEIILVNDGSPDNSWAAIKEETLTNKTVIGMNLSRNFGQHYAIAAGLAKARGEWIVVMDCDLQDDPSEIPRLYSKALEGFDAVLARRKVRKDSFFKKMLSKVFYRLLSFMTETKQDAEIANFGIYSKKIIQSYNQFEERFRYFPVLIRWLGFKQTTLQVVHAPRASGKSTYNFKSLFRLASEIILAFSDKPLRLMVTFGMIITLAALVLGITVSIHAIRTGYDIQGWASLIISVWFLGGLIISSLGVIGLYIGRIFGEVKKRPNYVVAEIIENG